MKACRPPEQEPIRPTLPLFSGCARIHFTAASVSPTICESAMPPSARTLAATSSGLPSLPPPSRSYRLAQIAI